MAYRPDQDSADYQAGYEDGKAEKHSEEYELLKLIANRAKSFPNFPMGYNLQEIFAYLGEKQPIKEALEQPAQEPVAWQYQMDGMTCWTKTPHNGCIPLYTHPAPSWQGLSDDEIRNVFDKNSEVIRKETGFFDMIDFARAIEIALKEKNGR